MSSGQFVGLRPICPVLLCIGSFAGSGIAIASMNVVFATSITKMDWTVLLNELTRLSLAAVLGGAIGLERQINGHWAGLRTHIAVALGSAVFALVAVGVAPAPLPDATRVVQGIAAGIGFLGAGTILKLSDQMEVKGLTTASSIWLTAAVGTSSGLGMHSLAVSTTIVTLVVLALLRPMEKKFPAESN